MAWLFCVNPRLERQRTRGRKLTPKESTELEKRFYERRGWKADGSTKLHDWGAFAAADVRYGIELG